MSQELTFREIRYVEKRGKILKQAAKIFAKKGYEKTSLEEIATQLKLSKASLYHYIKSKDEVLFLIQVEAIDQVLFSIKQIQETDKTPAGKLEDVIRAYVMIVTQNHIIGALRQQELILPLKWRSKIIELRDKCDQEFQKIIFQGLENGHFQARDGKMAYMAAIGALNGILRWYSPKGKLSVSEISDAMADFILKGFGVIRKISN
ncbi:TetR/AcrR family transcriptional regulator [bacterium]|nr:TetR/AcrR family transcriptional regulator [bacterium]